MAAVQKKVASTLLEKVQTVTLGKKEYRIPQPTLGTLVMVSEYISNLPDLELNKKDITKSVVGNAKDTSDIARILAVLVLGAKKIMKNPAIGRIRLKRTSKRIFLNASPHEMLMAIRTIIYGMELSDFFSLTTFLQGINITEPTKVEMPTEATVSGQ